MNRKLLNIIFITLIIILLGFMIIPHTSISFRTRFFIPFGLKLNEEDVVLEKGDDFRLSVFGINKRVTFISSDFKVASVSINGNIKAKRVGKTYIKVKVDNKVLKCRVRVIDINHRTLSLKVGEKDKLKVKGLNWIKKYKSSNKKVATVDRKGVITGISKGTATVSVKIKGVTMKCKITVN